MINCTLTKCVSAGGICAVRLSFSFSLGRDAVAFMTFSISTLAGLGTFRTPSGAGFPTQPDASHSPARLCRSQRRSECESRGSDARYCPSMDGARVSSDSYLAAWTALDGSFCVLASNPCSNETVALGGDEGRECIPLVARGSNFTPKRS